MFTAVEILEEFVNQSKLGYRKFDLGTELSLYEIRKHINRVAQAKWYANPVNRAKKQVARRLYMKEYAKRPEIKKRTLLYNRIWRDRNREKYKQYMAAYYQRTKNAKRT